jgi:hypothetical protein
MKGETMKELSKSVYGHGDRRRCVQTFDHGVRRVTFDHCGESWFSFLIIPRASLVEGIRRRRSQGAQFHDCDWWTLIPGLDRWVRPAGYGGPGQPFADTPARLRSNPRYVVISQRGGLDI